MRPFRVCFTVLVLVAIFSLSSPAVAGEMRAAAIQEAIQCLGSTLSWDGTSPPLLEQFNRQVIVGDIVHYSMTLRTGPDPHDLIGLHRVVRERRPYCPIHTGRNLFFQHGDAKDFVGMMLPGTLSPSTPDDFGFAVFLARHDVDVWGIDQGWCFVSADETDFSFMANWDMARIIQDLRTGIVAARVMRRLTGSGGDRMILSGYSSGVISTIALLDQETQIPRGLRQVDGYIPVDLFIRTDSEEEKAFISADLEYLRSLYDAGQYEYIVPFEPIGSLARDLPNDESPYAAGFTNLGFMLFLTSYPGAAFPAPFHYWAGVLGDDGMPTDLRLTPLDAGLDFLISAIHYQPVRWFIDEDILMAGVEDSPYDDHLGQIRVPVLSVAAGGGMGPLVDYGISLLGSTDVQYLVPSLGPPIETDFAHIDLFTAPESEALFWAPTLAWIEEHTASHQCLASGETEALDDRPAVPGSVVESDRLSIERISPNPARGRVTIELAGSQGMPVRLDILDSSGRLVHSRLLEATGSGPNEFTVDDLVGFAGGVYFVRLSQNGNECTQRVVVMP